MAAVASRRLRQGGHGGMARRLVLGGEAVRAGDVRGGGFGRGVTMPRVGSFAAWPLALHLRQGEVSARDMRRGWRGNVLSIIFVIVSGSAWGSFAIKEIDAGFSCKT